MITFAIPTFVFHKDKNKCRVLGNRSNCIQMQSEIQSLWKTKNICQPLTYLFMLLPKRKKIHISITFQKKKKKWLSRGNLITKLLPLISSNISFSNFGFNNIYSHLTSSSFLLNCKATKPSLDSTVGLTL